jgi:superfamily I DNA and/or RNA helicase
MWLDTDDNLSDWNSLKDFIDHLQSIRDKGDKCTGCMLYDYTWSEDRKTCFQVLHRVRIVHRDDNFVWKNPMNEQLISPNLGFKEVLWQNIREMGGRMRRGSYEEREGMRSRMSRLRDRATELEIQINADLFDSARVIASTLVSSNHRLLNGRRFPTLFIDEAAQALEAACWIAIRKADRVVLAGDHCQLPPTIKCYEAARGGLERTLMEKVVSNKPAVVSLLKVQYRMHEEIMKFPSQWFYNGELEAAPEVRYRGILDWDTPIHWIDTSEMDFKEEFVGETFGRINKAEADLLLSELKIYINRISGNRILEEKIDFGIISPYKAQVQYLRSKIKADASLKPYRSLFTVNTVDGFQGQERDVIFISLVRANEEGQIGFLNDLRRMNVAITRARMKLVILGEAETLKHHGFYRKLLEFIQNIGNQ